MMFHYYCLIRFHDDAMPAYYRYEHAYACRLALFACLMSAQERC